MRDWILIVDDDEQIAEVLSLALESEGYATRTCASGARARSLMASQEFSAVLLDLRLGEESGLELIPRLREISPHVPIFMITAHGDVESAVEAFRHGVTGYIRKPFQEGDLKSQVGKAIEARRLRAEVRRAREAGAGSDVASIIRSRDPVMEPVMRRIHAAAQVPSNVVITGESGTGKELAARALHRCGPRRDGPFVAFNCAALPEHLLESELFGHVRGAFTDARDSKPGLFVRAHKGTLFLDEIGDAGPAIQAKLLRVLQEREVLPLGATTPVKVDVRLVAATHKSLQDEVAAGRFRSDLFFRIHVLPIHLPPLRERRQDIGYLAHLLGARLAEEMGYRFEGFSEQALAALESHPWPGNVRELQNRLEHALAVGQGGLIVARALFPEGAAQPEAEISAAASPAASQGEAEADPSADPQSEWKSYKEAKNTFEKSYLERMLIMARGNIAQAARLAEKSRAEIYSLLRKHRLDPDGFKREKSPS